MPFPREGQHRKDRSPAGRAYRGRFAPSPTGVLHFGSLVAALGSYLDALSQQGEWLLRIEDVDEPRSIPGAADDILHLLESLGFEWHGEVVWQSRRKARYREILDALIGSGHAFPCACSRREIAEGSPFPQAAEGGFRYPGTCRHGLPPGREARAWRLRVPGENLGFEDRIQGHISQNLDKEVGDFVLLRADGFFAYQLAVVVDDADAGITHIVRGADLLDSTPRQIFLQHCLGQPTPHYAHLPVACNAHGEKWSKQTRAPAIAAAEGAAFLVRAMRFLGQTVPDDLASCTIREFWPWAIRQWQIGQVPQCRSIVSTDGTRFAPRQALSP